MKKDFKPWHVVVFGLLLALVGLGLIGYVVILYGLWLMLARKYPKLRGKRLKKIHRAINKKKVLAISASVLALFLIGAYISPKPSSNMGNVEQTVSEEVHIYTPEELLQETNTERKKVGVAPLQLDDGLNESARTKANDMRKNNYYDHISPVNGEESWRNIPNYISGCQYVSENIAGVYAGESPINDGTGSSWMNSKTHREAILDNQYDYIGFGTARSKDGLQLYVAHFCDLP